MKRAWDRIHVWLAANAPVVLASLRPGATEEYIRAAERQMGVMLPPDVKASYRLHDGQSSCELFSAVPHFLHGSGWLALEQMLLEWRHLVAWTRREQFEDESNEPAGPVRWEWYHEAWIPLTE